MHRFERLVAQGGTDPATTAAALALWRGPALAQAPIARLTELTRG
ncbi:hypothetical protein [Actinophytocola algeriensis]|uniref:Uncharacterized protein n=1 Tax=Actinophytocola algeriensis TaxID=1768010 RepID=A0A7W7Q2C5_9PSEU|nr:hypothetical protein [Actinophytocola algeriensis]MBB4905676.1 hypothetical protein [Actinophytocola algeriensis]MBE1472639.1 hypothetical protein [Actinophytocola algeriensis]